MELAVKIFEKLIISMGKMEIMLNKLWSISKIYRVKSSYIK